MQHRHFKIFLILTAFVLMIVYPFGVHAADATQQPSCGDLLTTDDPPRLMQIVCPIASVFNLLLFAAGVVFTVMLAYGGIKITSALGDPKGMDAGKTTLTYAVIGVACVIGVFTILTIIMKLLGLDYGLTSVFRKLQDAIDEVGISLGVYRP